ncbi:MAG: hypothetical protein RLZZ612_2228 [Pseudomonadota bacterium]
MLYATHARTGEPYGAALPSTSFADLDQATAQASAAFEVWQASDAATRAHLLQGLAAALESERDTLVTTADAETGLGTARLNGELDRTAFQLRRFAQLVTTGAAFAHVDDPAVPGPPPAGHPALMRVRVPLGPVAMFAASNFPFAFSVLGGDTASALAAGCTVVVKAHNGHLHTSRLVFALIQTVLTAQGLPAGVVQMVQAEGFEIGVALIQHRRIAAGAFTGSTRGGLALQQAARERVRPIPFYGELGSINPVLATPTALALGGEALAQTLAASIALGCGQFCTNPGLLVLQRSPESVAFVQALVTALQAQQPHVMLTAGMRHAFDAGLAAQLQAGARALLHEPVADRAPRPALLEVDADPFLRHAVLRDEVFGPSSLIVWYDDTAQGHQVLHAVGGALTVTLWGMSEDTPAHRAWVRMAASVAGRVLFAGVPTGVAVSAGQQHGGPWPSSTAPFSTSVGDAALDRFLRPVAYQDAPAWLSACQGQPC